MCIICLRGWGLQLCARKAGVAACAAVLACVCDKLLGRVCQNFAAWLVSGSHGLLLYILDLLRTSQRDGIRYMPGNFHLSGSPAVALELSMMWCRQKGDASCSGHCGAATTGPAGQMAAWWRHNRPNALPHSSGGWKLKGVAA